MDGTLWRLAHELAEAPDRQTFVRLAVAEMERLLCGDCFWMEIDFAAGECQAVEPEGSDPSAALADSLLEADDHPAIQSYLACPADLSPRRLSDVASGAEWRRTAAFSALSERIGRHQLSLVTHLAPPAVGHGWILGRSAGDFRDCQVELADSLLPILHALDRSHARGSRRSSAADPEIGLTPAETDVLRLLSNGLTAHSIARRKGVSERTVRKHLEHLYSKLDCHDRLVAVDRARSLGVLA